MARKKKMKAVELLAVSLESHLVDEERPDNFQVRYSLTFSPQLISKLDALKKITGQSKQTLISELLWSAIEDFTSALSPRLAAQIESEYEKCLQARIKKIKSVRGNVEVAENVVG